MPQKPSILFVLENFYPDYKAGTETYVYNLAKGLQNLNYKVTVVTASVGGKSKFYLYNELPVYALQVPEKITVHELNGLVKPSNLNEFAQLIEYLKPDIVHFHSFSRSFTHFHLKTAFELGCKTIFTAHLGGIFCARADLCLFGKKQCNAKIELLRCSACYASVKYNAYKSYAGALFAATICKTPLIQQFPGLNLINNKQQSMKYLANYTHKCIAIAYWIEKAFCINGINQTTVITQAIDTSIFKPKSSNHLEGKIQLGFIGRLNPSKGLHVLLNALKLNNLYTNFELQVVTIPDTSETAYGKAMKQQFEDFGYSGWYENKSHVELDCIMDSWDLLVLPSFYEVAPLIIFEAFAKNIPCIGSNIPAIAEVIKPGINGYIFETGNVENLAKQLHLVLENRNDLYAMSLAIEKPKDTLTSVIEHEKVYELIF